MPRRHDPFLKLLYRAGARDAVTLFFPDLAANIDWPSLRWIDKEVPIPGVRPRSVIADLVGLTRDVEGRHLEVLIHPEIQMRPAPDLGARALQYNAALWLQVPQPNTPVLYRKRRVPVELQRVPALLDPTGAAAVVEDEGQYSSFQVRLLQADAFAEHDNPMAWGLAGWMRQPSSGRAEQRLRLQDRILRKVREEPYRRLLLDAVRTYFTLSPAEEAEEERLLRSGAAEEVRETMLTELGKLERNARIEGRREGTRLTTLAALEARFGPLPPAAVAAIELLPPARLRELVVRSYHAESLADLSVPVE